MNGSEREQMSSESRQGVWDGDFQVWTAGVPDDWSWMFGRGLRVRRPDDAAVLRRGPRSNARTAGTFGQEEAADGLTEEGGSARAALSAVRAQLPAPAVGRAAAAEASVAQASESPVLVLWRMRAE